MADESGRLSKLVEINDKFIGFRDTFKVMDDEMFTTAVELSEKLYGSADFDFNWDDFDHGRPVHCCFASEAARIDAIIGEDGYIICALSFNDDRLGLFAVPLQHKFITERLFANPYSDYHDRTFFCMDFELDGQKKVAFDFAYKGGMAVPQHLFCGLCPLVDKLFEMYSAALKAKGMANPPDFS